MRVLVADAALGARQPPAHGLLLVRERRRRVALAARRLRVGAGERPVRDRVVVEARDLEGRRRMTAITLEPRRCQAELAEVHVVVAAAAIARDAPVARAAPELAVGVGR